MSALPCLDLPCDPLPGLALSAHVWIDVRQYVYILCCLLYVCLPGRLPIGLYVCMHVCRYVCHCVGYLYVCLYGCIYGWPPLCIYASLVLYASSICLPMYRMHVWMYVFMPPTACNVCMCVCMYVCICLCTFAIMIVCPDCIYACII